MRAKKEFYKLAYAIVSNPSKYVRKTTDYHTKRHAVGLDAFGDIVNWTTRQLELANDAKAAAKEDRVSVRTWFDRQVRILRMLMHDNLISNVEDGK